jgi:hypothetical protein
LIRRANGLAVEHGGAGRRLATGSFTILEKQRMVDAGPDAFALPAAKVVVDRLPRRKVMRQEPPGASGAQQVEDGIDDLALVGLARAAAGAGVGDHGRDGGPLIVGQVGGVGSAAGQGVDPRFDEVDAP